MSDSFAPLTIDLNCDLGEGFPHDAELMPLITSANIACGGHAGSEETIWATVELALSHGVSIGAHPGYEDPEHFGRRECKLAPGAVRDLVLRQIDRIAHAAVGAKAELSHVKPHGALYNQAARDPHIALEIISAVQAFDSQLTLVVLAGSPMHALATSHGLKTVSEVFADRRYRSDGTLVPRSEPNAVLHAESEVLAQVLRMIQTRTLLALDNTEISIEPQTLCLHGDTPHAVQFALALRDHLKLHNIAVRSCM